MEKKNRKYQYKHIWKNLRINSCDNNNDDDNNNNNNKTTNHMQFSENK